MYFYACPYCPPSLESRLYSEKVKESQCGHKKTFFGKDKECREDNYECKVSMKCEKCGEVFKITEGFLGRQKRKIKDG
jgi:hypothetical protein